MSSHLECLICTHDMGWHRQKLGACLECGCGAFQFQPHETLAELERLEALVPGQPVTIAGMEVRLDPTVPPGEFRLEWDECPLCKLLKKTKQCTDTFCAHFGVVMNGGTATQKSEFKREDLQNEAALDRGGDE